MRRALLALMVMISPALAAEKAEDTVTVIKGGAPGTNVEMPYLMAPMNGPDGKLNGYAYISTRLTASSPSAAANVIRDKLAFIQDTWVRDVNGTAVSAADDPAKVDIAALETRLAADAKRVVGAANVKMVTVCTVQVADLHPKQTANLAGTADASALKTIPKSRCEPELAAK